MKKNLILLGMMAVGKTTIGKIVAKELDLEFIDTDANIEKENAMKIKEIFEQNGEEFFRNEEEKITINCLEKHNCLIALGGGAFMNRKIREKILKRCISIWLDADIKVLTERVKWNKNRPLLNGENIEKKLVDLYNERKKIYKLATVKINCDNLDKTSIVKKIIKFYENY